MATTPTYAFNLPTVGGDINTWGTLLNANWTNLDNRLDGTTALTGTRIADAVFTGTTTLESVGVGTAIPEAKLHVNSGGTNLVAVFESTDAGATVTVIDSATTGGSAAEHGLNAVGDQLEVRAVDNISFETGGVEAMNVNGNQDVEISNQLLAANGSAAAPSYAFINDPDSGMFRISSNVLGWSTNGLEKARIASSNLIVGKDTTDVGTAGVVLKSSGQITATGDNLTPVELNRLSAAGSFLRMSQGGTERGVIGSDGSQLYIDSDATGAGIEFQGGAWAPRDAGVKVASVINLGSSTYPMDQIFHTGSIGSSDENMKHDVKPLTDAEMELGKLLSDEFVTFKWNQDRDDPKRTAKTISGVIAQRVAAAFTTAGLDWRDYGVVTRGTWMEAEVRYPEIKAVAKVEGQSARPDTPAVKGRPHIAPVAAVEGRAAFSRIETWDARSTTEPPADAVEKERWGVDKDQLWVFIMRYQSQLSKDMEARITLLEGNK